METWYFELWLETYSSDIDEYLTVFETVQKHLKKISPKLRLGGVGASNETSIPMEDVVKRWADLGQAPDFFTFYSYPYISQDIPIAYEARTLENAGRVLSANFVEKLLNFTIPGIC